jgi:cytochrome c biogenesis protein CcdA
MLPALAEAIRATTQPCTLLLLLPSLLMVVVTRGRWAPFVAMCAAAVLGGWLVLANVVALSDIQLQVSGVLVVIVLTTLLVAPAVSWPGWAEQPPTRTAAAGFVTFVATQWWRPCIGAELGSILTASRDGLAGQLPGMAAYMLGAMVPVLVVRLIVRVIDPSPRTALIAGRVAGVIGLIVAGALAVGRHDELVTALTRWTTS